MAEEKWDYWAAFAIGAVLGIGATMMLAPEQPTGARRILREIEPALKRARKGSRRVNKGVREVAREMTERGARARRLLRYR